MALPNKNDVRAWLVKYAQDCLGGSKDRRTTHKLLQRAVADLASQFGLRAALEYPVVRPDGRRGLIDVVWLSGSSPIAGFEVDSSRRKKSLKKLLTLPATLRFWVYYGNRDPCTFVKGIDVEGRITVICTNCKGGEFIPADMSTTAAANTGPGVFARSSANQLVRQAIQECWQAMPAAERSMERVEQEMARLTRRALRTIEEDLQALSECDTDERRTRSGIYIGQAGIRSRYPRAYERWTEKEDGLLQQEFSDGASVQDLSAILQRRPSAIRSRLRKLGSM